MARPVITEATIRISNKVACNAFLSSIVAPSITAIAHIFIGSLAVGPRPASSIPQTNFTFGLACRTDTSNVRGSVMIGLLRLFFNLEVILSSVSPAMVSTVLAFGAVDS